MNRIFTARKWEGNVFSPVCLSARLSTCVKIWWTSISVKNQYLNIRSTFNLASRQQWNFPSHLGTLYLRLRITSVSTFAGCDQFKPAQASVYFCWL